MHNKLTLRSIKVCRAYSYGGTRHQQVPQQRDQAPRLMVPRALNMGYVTLSRPTEHGHVVVVADCRVPSCHQTLESFSN